jgi:HlyD family secretion protein
MSGAPWSSRASTLLAGVRSTPRLLGLALPLVLALAALGVARVGSTRTTADADDARVAVAEKRDFVRTLRLNGVLEATKTVIIAAPRLSGQGGGSLIVTRLAAPGAAVKAGDLLVRFDPQAQLLNYLQREAEHIGLLEELKRKRAEQESAAKQDDAELSKAERDVQRAQLDVRKSEVLSRIDAEKNGQTLEEANVRLEQLTRKRQLRETSARADLRALQIRAERARRAMDHAHANMEKLEVVAPMDGVVVLTPVFKDNGPADVQEGDEVRPGQSFIQVVDPNTMQVRLKVNQADLYLLKVGQPARLHLDAYSDIELPARLEQLGAVGSSAFSDRVRTFVGIVSVGGSDPRMMPDLSAAVDVELERVKDVVVLPRDAVREQEGGRAVVRVRGGGTREVKLGARSDHEVVIVSGIEPGTAVLRGAVGG